MSLNQILRALNQGAASKRRSSDQRILMSTSLDPNEIYEWQEIQDLSYDTYEKRLKFIIKVFVRTPKITRYVTNNYVKTPIYGEYKERSKVINNFNKIINPEKFINIDILNLKLEKEHILNILEVIDLTPPWRQKEIDLENLEQQIKDEYAKLRNFEEEKQSYNFKIDNLNEKQHNFWLRFCLIPLTLGLSFLGFQSKRQVLSNIKNNKVNKQWNENHRQEIDLSNQKLESLIESNNDQVNQNINNFEIQKKEIRNREVFGVIPEEDGWLMVKEASFLRFENLKGLKGVYIIKNINKNIYYVGQSKDLYQRLNQHFKNGEVNNLKFAKDWYAGDIFAFKYKVLNTKDELDSEEKRMIELYDSFNNGYNATGGNL